ncbi:MAG TPA: hypothetical protein VL285_24480 [Bryobacteraceae bacterium]|jgi:hypothetical protein|nr:hypothetical protein [Bryobacteraceae bacterium]
MYVLLCLVLFLCPCRGEIIDRVAVVVGNRVITESEILREIRLTAFLNGTAPDFTPASRRSTADLLVEQRLIGAEIESSRYPQPSPESVEESLKEARSRFPDVAAYEKELQRAGITEGELKARLQRQLVIVRFLEFRFRPGIQISEDEINGYFSRKLEPELKKAHPDMVFSLDDYRPQVEQALTGEFVDKAAGAWLKEARARMRIEFRPAAFAPEAAAQEAEK